MKFILVILFSINFSFAQESAVAPIKVEKNKLAKSDKIAKEDVGKMEKCIEKTSLRIILNKEVFLNKKLFIEKSKPALAEQESCINFFVDYVKKYNQYIDESYYKAIATTSKRISVEKKYIEAVLDKMNGVSNKNKSIQGFSASIRFYMEQERLNWEKVPLKDDLTVYKQEKEEKSFLMKAFIYLFTNSYIIVFLALIFFLIRSRFKKNKNEDYEDNDLDL